MSSSTAVGDDTQQAPPVEPAPTWFDDSMERINNPLAYARKNMPKPVPELQKEISLAAPGGQGVKLEVWCIE